MKKKFLLTATLVATMTLAAPMVASAAEAGDGAWQSNAKGWWWQYSNGSYVTNDFVEVNGNTYYFGANGYMATGWQEIETKSEYSNYTHKNWYYFESNGAMVKDSWKQIDGKWYFFDGTGAMAQDGTYYIGDKEQVFAPSGQWVSGWTFDSYTHNGYTQSGWYYANSDGTPYDYDTSDDIDGGWLQSGSYWYYISSYSGKLYTSTSVSVKGTTYCFNSRGQMVTGWYQYGNTASDWMYCNADGTAYDGWLAYNGSWYYINDGYMEASDWVKSSENSDVRYYLGRDGKMVTGWYNVSYDRTTEQGTGYIYTNADGSAYTGWVADAGKWYYINDGYMQADTRLKPVSSKNYKKADGTTDWDAYYKAYAAASAYVFDKNGVMVTGWYQDTATQGGQTTYNVWYYTDADGRGHDGWLQYNGSWYYIKDGVMLINQYTPDGYFVGMDGVWR